MLIIIIFGLLVALLFPNPAYGQVNDIYAPNSFIVKFKDNVTVSQKTNFLNAAGASDSIEIFSNQSIQLLKAQTYDVQKTINQLNADENVEYAEPDYYYYFTFTPNDPKYSTQYHLPNIKADKAWDITRGLLNVYIADVDSGILESHPDFAGKIYKAFNLSGDSTMSDKRCPHGTAVAGTFGATTNNGVGVAGVGFNTKIIAIKIKSDIYCQIKASDIIAGIKKAADSEAQVINLSLGSPQRSEALGDVIAYALNKGKIIVASAGNSGTSDKHYPAAFDGVISVAASNEANKIAIFSTFGTWVDLVAPGVKIITTENNNNVATYAAVDGTSFSSPIVAGVAALMKSKNPNLTATQVTDILCNTADKISGTGTRWRCGKVNAEAAVKAAGEGGGPTPTPTATPKPSSTPTPPPSSDDVFFKFRFQGIDVQAKNQTLTVKGYQNNLLKFTLIQGSSNDSKGIYQVRLDKATNNLVAGNIDLKVKGVSHLQKAIKNIAYTGLGTTLDLSLTEDNMLLAGDTTNDNKITIEDLSNISRYYTDFSVVVDENDSKMQSADITKDGFITVGDLALAAINWSDLTVTGDE